MLKLECGCDEVGRGSAIAEIYVCACILPPDHTIVGLRDSKKLSPAQRERLEIEIKRQAICWNIAMAGLEEIDQMNIHHATLLAMKRAVEGLSHKPGLVYVDGLHVPQLDIPSQAIVKGDDIIPAISAASILAKVARDRAMAEYHKTYPQYGFDKNKGYLTKEHLEALREFGPSPIHRRAFRLIREAGLPQPEQLELFNETAES